MREIKFRAYDVESQKMYQITDINFSDYSANGVCYGDWKEFSINNLLQYTGLKDKNGMGLTEVYEGDIISEDGILKGNIYENDKREADIVIPQLGTKDWETTYKEIVARGYDYSK